MSAGRILLHVCCANCLFDFLAAEGENGLRPSILFYNPNIQPLLEYRRRRKSVLLAARRLGLEIVDEGGETPSPEVFLKAVKWQEGPPERCPSCYRLRMERTAREAAGRDFEGFISTLQVSGHQRFGDIIVAGKEAADKHGVEFVDRDLREFFGKGSPPRGFKPYRQQYCGCVFSEYERFGPTKTHLLTEAEDQ